ncbi:MAG: DUF547 domain-containing protein [Acidobacteriota bacterium]
MSARSLRSVLAVTAAMAWLAPLGHAQTASAFDHAYTTYASVLKRHVRGARVDYSALKARRGELDDVVAQLGSVTADDEQRWSRAERLAYWINAYNVFTLRAIVDHYPIKGSWLSLYPRNSIRQIDGVWTELKWRAAGRDVTLDQIEHEILRPVFREPRVHMAINCASVGCPPLASEPYRAGELDEQLDAATTRYLASPLGLAISGDSLQLSSIFKWFGADFEARFAADGPAGRTGTERALLGLVARYGPPQARDLARTGKVRIAYLDYDWSLNDTAAATSRR